MADEETIKRMQERINNLEGMVNSLLIHFNPATVQTTAGATPDATDLTPPTTTKAPKKEALSLMGLPSEIRILIIEHIFHPLFAPQPSRKSRHGLILPRRLPISLFTSKTRFPAILHVNHTTRVESKQVYFKFAQAKIAELEVENREACAEWKVVDKTLFDTERLAERIRVEVLAKMNVFKMEAFDKACRVLEGKIVRR